MKTADRYLTGAFLLLLIAFFSPVLFTGRTYFIRDLLFLFHPWKTLCTEMLQAGTLPLWNPYAYSGMPLLANWQTAVFYPFSSLFYFFGFTAGLKLYHLITIFSGSLFAYLFGLKCRLGRWPAAGMMVLYALNGYIIYRLEFLSLSGTLTWSFAVLLLADTPVLLAVAAAIALTAGHQVSGCLAAILLIYQAVGSEARLPLLRVLSTAGALLAAAALSAAQLLPTLNLALLTERVHAGIPLAEAVLNALTPRELLRLGSPLITTAASLAIEGERFPWQSSYYIGISGCLAAAAGLLSGRRRRIASCALLISLAGMLLSLGSATPAYGWLYAHISAFRFMRYPVQYLIAPVIGCTLLAGIGLARFRYAAVAVLVIAAELFLTSWGFHHTAPDAFFTEQPPVAAPLRSEPQARFILSPGTESNRLFNASSIVDAWRQARNSLYGLTALPCHLSNAYGSGEPLRLRSIARLITTLYEQPDPETAAPFLRNHAVSFMICRNELPSRARSFTRLTTSVPLVYRLAQPAALVAIQENNGTWRTCQFLVGRNSLLVQVPAGGSGGQVIGRLMYAPGWQAYTERGRQPVQATAEGYMRIPVTAGCTFIRCRYLPAAVPAGIWLSIITVILLTLYGIIKLHNFTGTSTPVTSARKRFMVASGICKN